MKIVEYRPPYRKWLLDTLLEKRGRNSSYSIRAYARDLGISKTALSEVLQIKDVFLEKMQKKL